MAQPHARISWDFTVSGRRVNVVVGPGACPEAAALMPRRPRDGQAPADGKPVELFTFETFEALAEAYARLRIAQGLPG